MSLERKTLKQARKEEEIRRVMSRKFELLGLIAEQITDSALTGDGMLSPEQAMKAGYGLF